MRRGNDGGKHPYYCRGGPEHQAWSGVRLLCIRRVSSSYLSWHVLILCGTGGSTIVLLFEKGMVEWDEDMLINGRASLETLVRVGMGVGRAPLAQISSATDDQPRGLSFNSAS
jgi:hypothetical protein